MNVQLIILILLCICILTLLFHFFDLESNIIILLGVIILFIINKLINKHEFFEVAQERCNDFDSINNELQQLITKLQTIVVKMEMEKQKKLGLSYFHQDNNLETSKDSILTQIKVD